MRKSLLTKTEEEKVPAKESLPPMSPPAPKLPPIMSLSPTQRKRLQQQMQQVSVAPSPGAAPPLYCITCSPSLQHVQLLTQLHLLSFRDPQLCAEADTAHMYLVSTEGLRLMGGGGHSRVRGLVGGSTC